MNKELMKKFHEVAGSDDEEAKREFVNSEEFKQFKDEFTNFLTQIKKAFTAAVDYYKPIFKALLNAHKVYEERNKHIRKISYKKKKSQRKNWSKWK